MQTIPFKQIAISDRQRRDISPKELLELKRSILSKGLLHAPVLSLQDDKWKLICGERRIRAMKELFDEGHTFTYNTYPVDRGLIPYTTVADMTEEELWEAELEENILRQPLTWLEEAQAKAKIHAARLLKNPEQTVSATAREIAARTENAFSTERQELAASIIVSQHKDDERVLNSRSLKEAHRAVLDKAEAFFRAELARRSSVSELPHRVILGNCLEVMPTLEGGQFDLILSDPPYGIAADKMGKDTSHFYDDSADYALKINQAVLQEGFRLTKNKALAFLFCDIEHFITLRDFASQMAWTPWRTPIIWYKGAEGNAPWGKAGFTRTYECLLFASKGQKELYRAGGPDVICEARVARGERQHAAEKPVALLSRLLTSAGLAGDAILDPCCGSGPIFPAAHKLKIRAVGIEIDETYYNQATVRLGDLQHDEADIKAGREAAGKWEANLDKSIEEALQGL